MQHCGRLRPTLRERRNHPVHNEIVELATHALRSFRLRGCVRVSAAGGAVGGEAGTRPSAETDGESSLEQRWRRPRHRRRSRSATADDDICAENVASVVGDHHDARAFLIVGVD